MNETSRKEISPSGNLMTEVSTPRCIQGRIKTPIYCPECGDELVYGGGSLTHPASPGTSCVHEHKQFKPPTIPLEIVEDTKKMEPCPYTYCTKGYVSLTKTPDPTPNDPLHQRPYYVFCNICGARGPTKTTAKEAVQGWNSIFRYVRHWPKMDKIHNEFKGEI